MGNRDDDVTSETVDARPSIVRSRKGRRPTLPPGTTIGRYQIVRRMGAGGMGVVYEAVDPELDRRIALKLVAVDPDGAGSAGNHRERMLREAHALAHLSHPNIVAIHDVGTANGDIFIALELVAGQTLADWLIGAPRGVDEIIAVFIEAGLGLAAAHQAGLVHRDVKPHNILVGDDGRVRVIDFGLVRAVDDLPEAEHPSETPPPDGDSGRMALLSSPLTQVGTIMGTPKYMSPEQHLGQPADARSDQFSFCAALYEAVAGVPPFAGTTSEELSSAIKRSELQSPTKVAHVPTWLRNLVRRGTARDPALRYPSMDHVLAELRRDRRSWRRRTVIAGVLATSVVLAVLGWRRTLEPVVAAPRCEGGASLAHLWDEDDRRRVSAAFAATGHPSASEAFARVDQTLRGFSVRWADGAVDACEATFVRGTQSEHLLDLRVACLERKRAQIDSLVETLGETSEPGQVDKAAEAAARLASVSRCSDLDALGAAAPLPEDPAVRSKVAELRRELDRAETLTLAGRFKDGQQVAGAARDAALSLAHDPLTAEAFFRVAMALDALGEYDKAAADLRAAAAAAGRVRDYRLVARAWSRLIWVHGYRKSELAEAMTLRHTTEVAFAFIGRDDELRAEFLNQLGAVFLKHADYDQAKAHFVEAIVLYERALGPDTVQVGFALNNLGLVLMRTGDHEAARGHLERTLRIWERDLGPSNPRVATPLSNLGRVCAELEDFDCAARYFSRVLAMDEASLGPEHPSTGASLGNLGLTQLELGLVAEAEVNLARSHAIFLKSMGPKDHGTALTLANLALVDSARGRGVVAARHLEAALATLESVGAGTSEDAADQWLTLAEFDLVAGKVARARARADKALQLYKATIGDKHAKVANTLRVLAEIELRLGRSRPAADLAARALTILDQRPDYHTVQRGRARSVLARALAAAGDVVRARELGGRALVEMAASRHPLVVAERTAVERWLAQANVTTANTRPF